MIRALFDSEAVAVELIECEWKPAKNLLGDRTAFDAVVVTRRKDGSRHLIGVETKYTETFSPQPYVKDAYLKAHDASGWFRPDTAVPKASDSNSPLSSATTNQLWRNTLLAASCELSQTNEISSASVAVVALKDDPGAVRAVAGLHSALIEGEKRCRFVSFEALVAECLALDGLAKFGADFQKRYVDPSPVQASR